MMVRNNLPPAPFSNKDRGAALHANGGHSLAGLEGGVGAAFDAHAVRAAVRYVAAFQAPARAGAANEYPALLAAVYPLWQQRQGQSEERKEGEIGCMASALYDFSEFIARGSSDSFIIPPRSNLLLGPPNPPAGARQ